MKLENNEDKNFIIRVIQYLEYTYGISFFITTKDFDVLYGWWEKGIPFDVIKNAFATVVERWSLKNKPITSFANFSYEVKKSYKAYLELQVGSDSRNEGAISESGESAEKAPERPDEFEVFFSHFPPELESLRSEFEAVYARFKEQEEALKNDKNAGKKNYVVNLKADNKKLITEILLLFEEDPELNLKVTMFKKHLAAEFQKPEIEVRYRLNFLINKFKIPYQFLNL